MKPRWKLYRKLLLHWPIPRYVLAQGGQGDLLDLYVALAPCVIGYGEIGARLAVDPDTRLEGTRYASWIAMYAGAEYSASCPCPW